MIDERTVDEKKNFKAGTFSSELVRPNEGSHAGSHGLGTVTTPAKWHPFGLAKGQRSRRAAAFGLQAK